METVAVIGLGYVGLPLVLEFGLRGPCIGFDTSPGKVEACRAGVDPNREIPAELFSRASQARYTTDPQALREATAFIIAVPTPVDVAHTPDLQPLLSASEVVGRSLRQGSLVVYESTVYPGCTEEDCVPVLERASGLVWKKDFSVGYSPERINPGDIEHSLTKVVKVVSGDMPETLQRVARLYAPIVKAGLHLAPSIKVAEASKVIENTQRDLNIALMNELSMIFREDGIDTSEVLRAAGTKWNFLRFTPGLVGGHCIGVDPYYLTHREVRLGYHPEVILAGRRINDAMGRYIASQAVKQLIQADRPVKGAKAVVLGLTFKEDCPDLRNTRVLDIYRELRSYGCELFLHDPLADPVEVEAEFGAPLTPWDALPSDADLVVLAVPHAAFRPDGSTSPADLLKPGCVLMDVKSAFDPQRLNVPGLRHWRL